MVSDGLEERRARGARASPDLASRPGTVMGTASTPFGDAAGLQISRIGGAPRNREVQDA